MDVHEILSRPYSRVMQPDAASGTFAAFIKEFPGCVAQGDSPTEAYKNLEGAAEFWLADALKRGLNIPEPDAERDAEYSGRVVLRMPRSLHRRAAMTAEREGVSLNTILVTAVAAYIASSDTGTSEARKNAPALAS